MPSLVLIDGGLGQLHAAAEALESLGFTSQPLASIAKKEEVIYLYGNEDEPIVLDRRSPVLHLVQLIRDESHRFAVGYHRQRRAMRDRDSELLNIPGVGPQTRQRLLTHFGSLRDVQQATPNPSPPSSPAKPPKPSGSIFRRALLPCLRPSPGLGLCGSASARCRAGPHRRDAFWPLANRNSYPELRRRWRAGFAHWLAHLATGRAPQRANTGDDRSPGGAGASRHLKFPFHELL
jgi:hypothetical protein